MTFLLTETIKLAVLVSALCVFGLLLKGVGL